MLYWIQRREGIVAFTTARKLEEQADKSQYSITAAQNCDCDTVRANKTVYEEILELLGVLTRWWCGALPKW